MFTPQQLLQFLHELQALQAAQNQAANPTTPQSTEVQQQGPQPLTPEQLALAALNGMTLNAGAGFWGTGGGYVQGGNLVSGAGSLINGKVFVPR